MRTRALAALAALALAMFALAACGDDDDTSSSDTTTTTAANGDGLAADPLDCDGTSAYVEEVGSAGDFTPATDGTLTVVTSLPGPGFWVGSESDPTALTGGFEYDIAHKLASPHRDPLTNREREVAQLLAAGMEVKAIAERLGLSPKTVHVHRANLMDKLNVSNNVELAHRMLDSW